jgi:hypothetical protein
MLRRILSFRVARLFSSAFHATGRTVTSHPVRCVIEAAFTFSCSFVCAPIADQVSLATAETQERLICDPSKCSLEIYRLRCVA